MSRQVITASRAARQLNVGLDLLRGLINSGQIDGWTATTAKGNLQWFVYADDVVRLRARMEAVGT